MTDLSPECVETHRKTQFAVQEYKSIVVFDNPKKLEVRQVAVDGCIFVEGDGERCDWLILVNGESLSVFVELKGSDIDKAFKQIAVTHAKLAEHLNRHITWIINYSGSPRFNTTIQNLTLLARSKHGARLLVRGTPYHHAL